MLGSPRGRPRTAFSRSGNVIGTTPHLMIWSSRSTETRSAPSATSPRLSSVGSRTSPNRRDGNLRAGSDRPTFSPRTDRSSPRQNVSYSLNPASASAPSSAGDSPRGAPHHRVRHRGVSLVRLASLLQRADNLAQLPEQRTCLRLAPLALAREHASRGGGAPCKATGGELAGRRSARARPAASTWRGLAAANFQ